MSNQAEQQVPPKKKSGGSLFYIIGIVILVFLIASSTNACAVGAERLSYDRFKTDIGLVLTPMGPNGEYTFKETTPSKRNDKYEIVKDASGNPIPEFADPEILFKTPHNEIRAIKKQGNYFYVLYRSYYYAEGSDPKIVEKFMSNPSKHGDYYFYYDTNDYGYTSTI